MLNISNADEVPLLDGSYTDDEAILMSAPVRYDEQYCPIARALDALGDRWTLLILRELVIGDQRFTDLRAHLPGITPAVLTARLHSLEQQGLLEVVPAPTGARSLYRVTARGRETMPVMRALARFGIPLLEDPNSVEVVRPWSAVQTCVVVWFDPAAAAGLDERYLLRVDGEDFVLSSLPGGGEAREPDLVVDTSAATLFAIRQGRITFDDAKRQGLLTTRGKAAAVRHLRAVFRLDEPAFAAS
jgi:DNA-binding HxlR family transcriptional regulator